MNSAPDLACRRRRFDSQNATKRWEEIAVVLVKIFDPNRTSFEYSIVCRIEHFVNFANFYSSTTLNRSNGRSSRKFRVTEVENRGS